MASTRSDSEEKRFINRVLKATVCQTTYALEGKKLHRGCLFSEMEFLHSLLDRISFLFLFISRGSRCSDFLKYVDISLTSPGM